MPVEADPEVFSLYIDGDTWGQIDEQTIRLSDNNHVDDILSRNSLRIRPGASVSFGTYFNAFPAAYWQRWTDLKQVTLTVKTSGAATILMYRSNARGIALRIDSALVSGKESITSFTLPLHNFIDGGWYWFDVVSGSDGAVVQYAEFSTNDEPKRRGKATVAITTFNRANYCLDLVEALGKDEVLHGFLDQIVVVDQGTDRVADQPRFKPLSNGLGHRLNYINQANLGGSGGFSRGMIEALSNEESDFVLLLDDDVMVEPEGVARAITFGRFTHQPTIIGGHMFDMFARSTLHSYSERVDRKKFMWSSISPDQVRHDFRKSNLRQTNWLHNRADVDFNGWWMSLIPLDIVREIGLSLPLFIKWDDAEYSLRAKDHGYSTVSFPGAAVWHVSWLDKDDFKDWQAYFHGRNRWIVALIHSPFNKGGSFPRQSFALSYKHLFKMQYYTDELYAMALDDVLSGPKKLHETMQSGLSAIRAVAEDYPETKVVSDSALLPDPIISVNDVPSYKPLSKIRLAIWLMKNAPRQLITPKPALVGATPQVSLSSLQASWWALAAYDSALVSTADGRGQQHYRRNSAEFKRRFKRTRQQHRKLVKSWSVLAQSYRSSLEELTSIESWKKTIGIP